jgi:hypothetical protein
MWSRTLINAVIEIIPKCASTVKILLVTLFIYAVLGTQLFAFLKPQTALDGYDLGFTNFYISLLTLVKIATGEKWF